MTLQEMKSVQGPELGNDRTGLVLHARCFLHGWDACTHKVATTRIIQQLVAGMRWIWWVYGDPATAWQHIERTKRFNSYPRPGTDNSPTRHPLAICPVAGNVSYRDSFGERRTTGGYHPHSATTSAAASGAPSAHRSPGWWSRTSITGSPGGPSGWSARRGSPATRT